METYQQKIRPDKRGRYHHYQVLMAIARLIYSDEKLLIIAQSQYLFIMIN